MANNGSIMDKFFDLGNRVTRNNPVRKAHFDYCLYWVVFLTFIFMSINYIYSFFKNGSLSSLGWGIVLAVFSWFNYWVLVSFRMVYLNMRGLFNTHKNITSTKLNEANEYKQLFN